ncbi:MAG: bifunctional glutamate N-acetyltransferase/amino-acid acetyltransferase ArgJ [Paracoccaceae bacterium]
MAQEPPVSPLAPASFPELPTIDGVTFSTCAAGVRYQGRPDVMLAELRPGTAIAGVFTRSSTRAAPVLDCQAKLGGVNDHGAAILVNSGNANAFTGRAGLEAVNAITQSVADQLNLLQHRVFTASTGVIGEPLPHDRVTQSIGQLADSLHPDGIADAARAIMTTDTFAKGAHQQVQINGQTVRIAGIAKGSGMIAPDMATMLVYVFTDAAIDQEHLQAITSECAEQTFNRITVDSDTSTSDTVMVAATGASDVDVTQDPSFKTGLYDVMLDLAHQVVRDGEGATKFIEISVNGAQSEVDAKTHALSIANSPLVKTAVAGEDPNWGRVVMAIGKSGAHADRDLISIKFGEELVAKNGWVHSNYDESKAAAHMKGSHIRIQVDLGLGTSGVTVWTCDLTHGYISINADYRS